MLRTSGNRHGQLIELPQAFLADHGTRNPPRTLIGMNVRGSSPQVSVRPVWSTGDGLGMFGAEAGFENSHRALEQAA